jgi:hypothetical protein
MATELIRQVWCDRCLTDDDKKVSATVSERVAIGQQIVETDLCDRCAEDLLTPARELLRLGRAPSPHDNAQPSPRSRQQQAQSPASSHHGEDYDCPRCSADFKTRQTFRKHLLQEHGMGFGEYLRSIGREPYPCTIKGCDFVGVDSAGLNLHKVRMHATVLAASNGRR